MHNGGRGSGPDTFAKMAQEAKAVTQNTNQIGGPGAAPGRPSRNLHPEPVPSPNTDNPRSPLDPFPRSQSPLIALTLCPDPCHRLGPTILCDVVPNTNNCPQERVLELNPSPHLGGTLFGGLGVSFYLGGGLWHAYEQREFAGWPLIQDGFS